MDKLHYKLLLCKKHLEAKGLRVNMGKTKIMICGKNLHSLKDSRKRPCGVCRKGIGSTRSFKGRLKADPKYRCKRCMGLCRPVDGKSEKHVTLEGIPLDVVE